MLRVRHYLRPFLHSTLFSLSLIYSLSTILNCDRGSPNVPLHILLVLIGLVPNLTYFALVSKSHSDSLQRTKQQFDAQLAEKAKEHERNLEDEKSRHEAEMEAMNRRHQKVVADLDEKVAEIEKVAEQLKNDKKALQTALANDSDQRNQMLSKEINSLQTALELKSSEMKELRQKYQQIALRVEEIPVKELEISKLKHKVNELKQTLDQKLIHEKILVHQNEELKRQSMLIMEEKDSMMRSIDVMMYKFGSGNGEGGSAEASETPPDTSRSGRVQMRQGRTANNTTPTHRPTSGLQGIPPEARLSTSSHSK
ncbi:hypothetical protein WR25_09778 isoform B [Diploscapter pachys]|uniref:Uncharacterized protein n=1 Tax=Diploscapter pachys TaxID=2018661 RepID=A0A2A2K3D4_9BILA|nr:hypothetical protein WR25_09778 isoform A [Diploscapter pachys]PAV68445.1 hypothetical protein WR25_09778 isoform B [Diploscapter pachys]